MYKYRSGTGFAGALDTCINTCICTCVYTCIYVYIRVYTCVYAHGCVCIFMHVREDLLFDEDLGQGLQVLYLCVRAYVCVCAALLYICMYAGRLYRYM